ncbi:unnamed protein product [Sphagnum jensenii]|jgi:hypothetical protein|uniref:Uncharacterized protein n=1 Tax=Sphagnum jensenii TaxID=128206 RepID=A0ABP0WTH6_9BRYO
MTPRRGMGDLFAKGLTKDWNIAFKRVYRSSSCLLFLISKLTDFSFGSQELIALVSQQEEMRQREICEPFIAANLLFNQSIFGSILLQQTLKQQLQQ